MSRLEERQCWSILGPLCHRNLQFPDEERCCLVFYLGTENTLINSQALRWLRVMGYLNNEHCTVTLLVNSSDRSPGYTSHSL